MRAVIRTLLSEVKVNQPLTDHLLPESRDECRLRRWYVVMRRPCLEPRSLTETQRTNHWRRVNCRPGRITSCRLGGYLRGLVRPGRPSDGKGPPRARGPDHFDTCVPAAAGGHCRGKPRMKNWASVPAMSRSLMADCGRSAPDRRRIGHARFEIANRVTDCRARFGATTPDIH